MAVGPTRRPKARTARPPTGPTRSSRRAGAGPTRPERRDSLILHKFEAILSFAAFLNLNRRVDEDDPDTAAKAARDADEIALTQVTKAPATRLKLHLDLAPEEADRARLSATHGYPEWEAKSGAYLPDHVRVLESPAEPAARAAGARSRARPGASARCVGSSRRFARDAF